MHHRLNSRKKMKKKLIYFMIITQLLNLCCEPLINRLAFFPNKEGITTPLPLNFEEKFIETTDKIKIHSILIPQKSSDKLVIYFHGNAGNIYHRLETLSMLHKLGVNVLGVSYRGYGKSEGKPSEKGIYTDGISALKYAIDSMGFAHNKIFLLGRSIGSAPAVNTALEHPVAGLILVTPLYSGKEMAKLTGLGFISAFAGNAFDNSEKLKRLKIPILIIHGTLDETVPFWMGKKLHEENNPKSTFIEIKSGTHNELEFTSPDLYWNSIINFLNRK